MKTKSLVVAGVILSILLVILFVFRAIRQSDLIFGVQPLYEYNGYQIYDLVKQKNLACAEMIEYFPEQVINGYRYYFECLKSDQIYMVKDGAAIKIKDAYYQGLITIEKMHEFGLVGRTVMYD